MAAHDEAIKVYEEAVRLKKRIGFPYYKLANAHFAKGQNSVATRYIDIAMSINPDNAVFQQLRTKIINS